MDRIAIIKGALRKEIGVRRKVLRKILFQERGGHIAIIFQTNADAEKVGELIHAHRQAFFELLKTIDRSIVFALGKNEA